MTPVLVAIVGSGPAGFYAAERLLRAEGLPVEVEMFDRLATPLHSGANSNLLADDQLVDRISGNAVLNGIPVELARVDETT